MRRLEPFEAYSKFDEELDLFDLKAEDKLVGEMNRSSSTYIRWIQSSLNRIMGLRLAVDGIMRPQTRSAIRSFQQRQGLTVDGIVGPQTEAALRAALTRGSMAPQPSGTSPASIILPAPTPSSMPCAVLDNFEFDKDRVRPIHQARIIEIARRIIASQTTAQPVRSVQIVGHTDPVGTDTYNLNLGHRRAEQVRRHLRETMERIRPGSAGSVTFAVETRGETQPISTDPARNRRVDICLPTRPVTPVCRYDNRNAFAIEREAARRTLDLSAQVANRFIRTVGAVGARGRFIPTVIDNKYWFAKLYEFTTYYEIGNASSFRHPAFVLHFIPIFYDIYYRALENWTAGNLTLVNNLWRTHFTRASRPNNSSIRAWMDGVRDSIVTGTTAHVQGDMATALERAYRSYAAKYCLSPPPRFDEFRPDFFKMDIVFEQSKAAFLLHLSQFGPFPVGPEWGQFLFAVGESLAGGLDIGEVHRWREAAWSEARRRLGQ